MTAGAHPSVPPYAMEDLTKPCGKCQSEHERIAKLIDQCKEVDNGAIYGDF